MVQTQGACREKKGGLCVCVCVCVNTSSTISSLINISPQKVDTPRSQCLCGWSLQADGDMVWQGAGRDALKVRSCVWVAVFLGGEEGRTVYASLAVGWGDQLVAWGMSNSCLFLLSFFVHST